MKTPITIILVIACILEFNAQHLTHDIGVLSGSTRLQSDYGQRGNFFSEWKNNGQTIAIAHYLSFYNNTIRWDPHDVIHNHLMVKTEFMYLTNANFKHHGKWAERKSSGGEQLRAMTGSVNMLDIGVNLEVFLHPLEEFVHPYSDIRFNPFLTFGVKYSFFENTLNSELGNWEDDLSILPDKYRPEDALDIGSGEAVSISFGIGTRYKLAPKLDFVTEFTYQYFFSDSIDGLTASVPENKNNEWLLNFQFGLVYHLNYNTPLFN